MRRARCLNCGRLRFMGVSRLCSPACEASWASWVTTPRPSQRKPGRQPKPRPLRCEFCARLFPNVSYGRPRRRPRRFCTRTCYLAWAHAAHAEHMDVVCPNCGESFLKAHHKRYCSPRCRQNWGGRHRQQTTGNPYERKRRHEKRGRVCHWCKRTDSDLTFATVTTCVTCARQIVRGRVCGLCGGPFFVVAAASRGWVGCLNCSEMTAFERMEAIQRARHTRP